MTEYALINPNDELVRTLMLEAGAPAPTIAPQKGRWLPVVTTGEAYDEVSQVRDGPQIVIGLAAVQRTFSVRPKSADEIAAMRAAKLAAVNAEAERRILAIMPEYKQRNALALGVEYVTTLGPTPGTWPAPQQALYASLMAAWAQIKAIRAKSDQLQAAVPQDAAGAHAFDPTQGWA